MGSNGNIIPTVFTFTATNLDTGEVFSETNTVGQGNKKGLQDDLLTCSTAPEIFEDPETGESFEVVIEVEAFLTPRG